MPREKFYVVTSVCKDDIREALQDKPKLRKLVDNLTDEQMQHIARKLEDDYVNNQLMSAVGFPPTDAGSNPAPRTTSSSKVR